MKNLAAALVKAQREMKNPTFDAKNPHFNSKYASLVAVREAVIPVFNKNGLVIQQWPGCKVEGERLFAGCRTVLMHDSGEIQEFDTYLPLDKANAHGAGSCITYARRYSLMAIAGVVGDEDDDANGAVETPKVKKTGDKLVDHIIAANVKPLAGLDEYLTKEQVKRVDDAFSSMVDMFEAGYSIEKIYAVKEEFDVQEQAYLWSKFDKKQKDALAKYGKQLRELHPATQA